MDRTHAMPAGNPSVDLMVPFNIRDELPCILRADMVQTLTGENSDMLTVKIDHANHVAILEPDGPLSEHDFKAAAAKVDALIETSGKLSGIVVHAKTFPGWESFAAMVSHLRFIKNHHEKLARVALATDSLAAHLAEVFSTHFVMAEIKIFPYEDFAAATQWVRGSSGR